MTDINMEFCAGYNAVVLVIPHEFIAWYGLHYPDEYTVSEEQKQAAFLILEMLQGDCGLPLDVAVYCYQKREDGCVMSVIHPSFPACEPFGSFPERFVKFFPDTEFEGQWKIIDTKGEIWLQRQRPYE